MQTAAATTASTPTAIADTWYEALAAKDLPKLKSLVTDDVCFRGSLMQSDGKEGFFGGLQMFLEGLDGIDFHTVIREGNWHAAHYTCRMHGPVPTLRCQEFIRVEGDKIAEFQLVFDSVEMRKHMPG